MKEPFLKTFSKFIIRSSHQKCSMKKLLLKISKHSQEICCKPKPAHLLKKSSKVGMFTAIYISGQCISTMNGRLESQLSCSVLQK